jgi:hypothetical protein
MGDNQLVEIDLDQDRAYILDKVAAGAKALQVVEGGAKEQSVRLPPHLNVAYQGPNHTHDHHAGDKLHQETAALEAMDPDKVWVEDGRVLLARSAYPAAS